MPTTKVLNEQNLEIECVNNEAERQRMKDYWVKHSVQASIQEMLLDSNAEVISDNELPEIISILPSFKSKVVLELGAGIGRFTRVLAQQAEKVTAVDFIEKFIEKNRELNKNSDNIDYVVGDVTKLSYNKHAFHMIFSNWLLMYLKDNEIIQLVENSLNYLKVGGYFFIRESCFHASGNIKNIKDKNENPTEYRSPTNYVDFFQSKVVEEDGEQYGFELIFARPNRTYIEMKGNGNQVCFLFRKVRLENYHGFKTMKEFFDHKQYTTKSILRYEKIYGKGYITTGGSEQCQIFTEKLNLKEDMKLLDVGCGLGGADFYMSEKYGVEVFGVDLRSNVIGIGWERLAEIKNENRNLKVRFEIGDVSKLDYPAEYFHCIYTTETLLHIADKKSLFNKFKYWLKPGGKLFVTDYCCGTKPWSDEFTCYVEQRGYELLTVAEYESLLKETGFVNIDAKDETETFISYLKKESDHLKSVKDEFVTEFSIQDFDYLLNSWKEKIARSKEGHHRWGIMYAEKKKL